MASEELMQRAKDALNRWRPSGNGVDQRVFHEKDLPRYARERLFYDLMAEFYYNALPTKQKPCCTAKVYKKRVLRRCGRKAEFNSEFCASHKKVRAHE